MIRTDISLEIILEHLESFKLNLNDEIINRIKELHDKYCTISLKNKVLDFYGGIKNAWLYTSYINCSIIINDYLGFKCFFTKKQISSVYSNYFLISMDSEWVIYYYYFPQGEDSFVLLLGGIYNLPIAVYYPYKSIYIPISSIQGFGYVYDNCSELINKIDINEINNNLTNLTPLPSLKILFFAWIMNPAHHLWNEISGIYLLLYTGLLNKIDVVVLGNYDCLNIKNLILEHNQTCKILSFNEFITDFTYLNKPIKYGLIGEGFVIEETKELIKNHIKPIKYTNKFVLLFNIKLNNRSVQNIDIIYINIINKLISSNILNPDNLYLLFDGLYKNNSCIEYYNMYKDVYNQTIQNIVNSIDKRIEYKSLIGLDQYELSSYFNEITYFIGVKGAQMYTLQHIYNKKGCLIYTNNTYDYTRTQDRCYFDNYIDIDEIVCTENERGEYYINVDLLYNCIINSIIELNNSFQLN